MATGRLGCCLREPCNTCKLRASPVSQPGNACVKANDWWGERGHRWFTRYAGWAPGQLQLECESGVWLVAAAGRGVVLASGKETGEEFWHKVLTLMGGDYAALSREVRNSQNQT